MTIRGAMVVTAICLASCATLAEHRAPQLHPMLAERRAPRWYLMLPPTVPWGNKLPLVEWQMADSFSSSAKCEAYRKGCCESAIERWKQHKSLDDEYFALRYKNGVCVAANDHRLSSTPCAQGNPECAGVQPLWGGGVSGK